MLSYISEAVSAVFSLNLTTAHEPWGSKAYSQGVLSSHTRQFYFLFFYLKDPNAYLPAEQLHLGKENKKKHNTASALPWLLSHLSRSTTFHQVSDPCQVSFVRKVTFPLASRPNKLGWKQFIIQGDYLNRSELSLLCQAPLVSFFPSQI